MRQYLANAISLVDSHVNNYQRRRFKNLMVSFGCTGGQHRSVYLAEQLAKHLRKSPASRWWCAIASWRRWQMKAMILAAGLGTRLRPLTDHRPKALVEIAGHTLLEITLARLRMFGVCEVIINVHHFADMVIDYLTSKDNFGMRIEVLSRGSLAGNGRRLEEGRLFLSGRSQPLGRAFYRAQRRRRSARLIWRAWRNFMRSIARSPPSRCRIGRLSGTCSSMSTVQLCGRRYGRDGKNQN